MLPSQSLTEPRKLSTIMLTPTVAETATASATIATLVRLKDAPTLEIASLAVVPPTLLAIGAIRLAQARTVIGMQSARPKIIRKSAVKPATRLVPETWMRITAKTTMPMPPTAMAGMSLLVLCSSTERESASRGW